MSRVIGMKVVPAVIGGKVLSWMGRVMCSGILIHNPIATGALTTNKAVDLLPLLLLCGRPVIRSFEWSQRRTDEANLLLVRPRDQALQPSDQLLAGRGGIVAEIVDRVVGENHPADIWLVQYVPLKTVLSALARTIDQKPVSTDSQIEDPNRNALADEAESQLVRPSMVRIVRCGVPFGNRGSQRHHASAERRPVDLKTGEKVNALGGLGICHLRRTACVSCFGIAGLMCGPMECRWTCRAGEIPADRNLR